MVEGVCEWNGMVEGVCVRESSDVIKGECGECAESVLSLSLRSVLSRALCALSLRVDDVLCVRFLSLTSVLSLSRALTGPIAFSARHKIKCKAFSSPTPISRAASKAPKVAAAPPQSAFIPGIPSFVFRERPVQ